MALIKIRNPVLQVTTSVTVFVVTMTVIDLLVSDDTFADAVVQSVLSGLFAALILYFVFIRRGSSTRRDVGSGQDRADR